MLQINKGYWLVLGTAFISGISIFINKFGVSMSSPDIFVFLKSVIVAIFLTALLVAFKDYKLLKSLTKKNWSLLFLIGLVGGSVPFLLFFKGLSITDAAGASFIQKSMFVWILILAGIFLKEKITWKYLTAGLLLMLGSGLLLKISSIHLDQGSLLVFLATLFWAVENVISKYTLQNLPPRLVMWGRMFFGSLLILLFLAFTGQTAALMQLSAEQIGWSLITGVLLIGYVMTWYTGLKYIKVSEAAIILMLGSPITTLLTTIFSRPLGIREYLATALIIIGVVLAIEVRGTLPQLRSEKYVKD